MQRNIKESADAATGVADGRKRGIKVNTETRVSGDVRLTAARNVATKSSIFFVAERVSSVVLPRRELHQLHNSQ